MRDNSDDVESPGNAARRLLRCCGKAVLATSLDGAPYASLVLCAVDLDASPLLLLSDLAQHSRNIDGEPRISLLCDGTAGFGEPLAGPRLTVQGRAEATLDPRLRARFTARHPSSKAYARFADFKLWRIVVERGHLVAGFGRIAWVAADKLLFAGDASALAAAEPAIVASINKISREILARSIVARLGRSGAGWRAIACDPEGLDVRRGNAVLRLEFKHAVSTPDMVFAALGALAE